MRCNTAAEPTVEHDEVPLPKKLRLVDADDELAEAAVAELEEPKRRDGMPAPPLLPVHVGTLRRSRFRRSHDSRTAAAARSAT